MSVEIKSFEIASAIWRTTDLIRDIFRRGKFQDVVLPFTVLRRVDHLLAHTKRTVLETYSSLKGKIDNLDPLLRKSSGLAYYNTSRYDFDLLLADPLHLAQNLRYYIGGFS